ncbi:uncharacterized protein LOC123654801 [Melitaea cinxia]|uniref:uncharacterized protein LOC123654801 n=1 Tax=Melitaea cinxia TaxID=113334 RepID=UPI001E26FECE|nr:uncharacterized protein LOC123654801 [Melitaea cinxia]
MEEQCVAMRTASSEGYTSVQNKSKECDKENFSKLPLDNAIDGSSSMNPKILPQVETEQRILKNVNNTSKISCGYNVVSTIEEQSLQNIRDRSNSTSSSSSSTSSSSSSSISSSSSKSSSSAEKNGGEMNINSSPSTIPDITERQIRTMKMKTNSNGFVEEDLRGRSISRTPIDPSLVQDIKNHINSILRIESHYLRSSTTREYIDNSKSIQELCRDFNNNQTKEKTSRPTGSTLDEEFTKTKAVSEDHSITNQISTENNKSNHTKEILDNLKFVNINVGKPPKISIENNNPYETNGLIHYILATSALTTGTGRTASNNKQSRDFLSDDAVQNQNSRSAKLLPNIFVPNPAVPSIPYPYILNVPAIPPTYYEILGGYNMNDNLIVPSNQAIQTRQQLFPNFPSFPSFPSFSFDNIQLQPFSQYFPVLIKNPFVALAQGGGWSNFIEYGQNADVCNRKQKSVELTDENINDVKTLAENKNKVTNNENNDGMILTTKNVSRQSRAIKKRTVPAKSPQQQVEDVESSKKLYPTKSSPTRKTTKRPVLVEEDEELKNSEQEGDLRFPFSDFSWFGNKKPVVPSPGFFINKLRVRKGGVAIAGPGGIATAGRGGTAIVGPGGLAYTKPGGLAIAGPHARVVALSPYDDTLPSIFRPHHHGYDFRSYYKQVLKSLNKFMQQATVADVFNYDGDNIVDHLTQEPTFVFHVKPSAFSMSGKNGIAISNPITDVIVQKGVPVSIINNPQSAAIAGPGGFAYAESELNYIPFYGGAKGQYLEVKKDTTGSIVSEKVVAEESISSENIIKNTDESLLSKVLAANLQSLRTLSNNLLKLHNLGKKTGGLKEQDKNRFKSQLFSLGEAASNTIKLIDEINDDIDVLFKKNVTLLRKYGDSYYDEVSEEGISIDPPNYPGESLNEASIIAEAKPVGLAVVGESGVAASRPIATAVAASGVAIARPVGTAIAGIDPTLLGIDYHVNHSEQKVRYKGQNY